MSSAERSLSDFTISDLKKILREMSASPMSIKTELIARILEMDSNGRVNEYQIYWREEARDRRRVL